VLGLLRHGRITLGLVVLRLEFEILMDDHDLVHMASVCVSVTVSNFGVMWQPLSRYSVLGAREDFYIVKKLPVDVVQARHMGKPFASLS